MKSRQSSAAIVALACLISAVHPICADEFSFDLESSFGQLQIEGEIVGTKYAFSHLEATVSLVGGDEIRIFVDQADDWTVPRFRVATELFDIMRSCSLRIQPLESMSC